MCILCQRKAEVAIELDGLEGREFPVCAAHTQFVVDIHVSLFDAFPPRQEETEIISSLAATGRAQGPTVKRGQREG